MYCQVQQGDVVVHTSAWQLGADHIFTYRSETVTSSTELCQQVLRFWVSDHTGMTRRLALSWYPFCS
ncbi:hypothetical protein ABBQ38_011046 [Trebouxia sp. C0009 RCD-2024]